MMFPMSDNADACYLPHGPMAPLRPGLLLPPRFKLSPIDKTNARNDATTCRFMTVHLTAAECTPFVSVIPWQILAKEASSHQTGASRVHEVYLSRWLLSITQAFHAFGLGPLLVVDIDNKTTNKHQSSERHCNLHLFNDGVASVVVVHPPHRPHPRSQLFS
jgi:hypothetical protein